MKFNSPIPQPLPKECQKAAKIFRSFVDGGNNGLDGIIPRSVLENSKGFAIFTVFKAGFLFSARGGSGVVIARLQDGTWSSPSAIGTAGVGVGGQVGAEMTDFLVVLNSPSAVRSFMAAGSLTLGGNLSIAVGPLGRNGEALGSLNTSGKMAAMYSYSKTRGLFGGVSLEGSVIVERQDANAQAYRSDVTAKMLLSGSIPPPEWADPLIHTLENCTGMPGNRRWVNELNSRSPDGYMFNGVESPHDEDGPDDGRSGGSGGRPGMGSRKSSHGSYFDFNEDPDRDRSRHRAATFPAARSHDMDEPTTDLFETKFESDFDVHSPPRKSSRFGSSSSSSSSRKPDYPFASVGSGGGSDAVSHRRSVSAYTPPSSSRFARSNPFDDEYSRPSAAVRSSYDYGRGRETDQDKDLFGAPIPSAARGYRGSSPPPPKIVPKVELARALPPHEGVARAIALFDFNAVQSGDLSFKKGQVITVIEKSHTTDTWWTGKVDGRTGIFPANFVEVV